MGKENRSSAGGNHNRRIFAGLVSALVLLFLVFQTTAYCEPAPSGPPARGGASTGSRYPVSPTAYVSRYPNLAFVPPPTLEQLNKTRVWDFDPQQGIAADVFTLWALDDQGQLDPETQQYVRLSGRDMEHGDYHLVVYLEGAPALTDLFFYIRYPAETWHPRQIEPGSAFGLEGDRLWFSKLDVPGVVCAGMTRIRPDINGGIKLQEGVVCEVTFVERKFDYKPHWLDRAPNGKGNRVANATAYEDPESYCLVLYFEEANQGDFNNDGEVCSTDLIPVGRRYGRVSRDGMEDEWDRLPDGNGDGEVNYRDVWLIQENYGSLLSGYRIYRRPASAPREEEVLLPHNTRPLLPMSIHRVQVWDPITKYEYRYFDRTLERTSRPQDWIYRIVPYNAADDVEGEGSDFELSVRVSSAKISLWNQR